MRRAEQRGEGAAVPNAGGGETAVGAASRPSASRAAITSTPMLCGQTPLSRQA